MEPPQPPANGSGLHQNGTSAIPVSQPTVPIQTQTISADEIALYDRQIRLWGVKAQERLRGANILLVRMKAVANEVAKNLVLAGIGTLTIVDHGLVTEQDLGAQFLLSEADVGKNRAFSVLPELRKLNPRVKVVADIESVTAKPLTYFGAFDITIATDLDFGSLKYINLACRASNRPFYAVNSHGLYGSIFADLIIHDFVIERQKSNVATKLEAETTTRSIIATSIKKDQGKVIEMVTKREVYSDLENAAIAPLPIEYMTSKRKLKSIPPLLPALLALWDFQTATSGLTPQYTNKEDVKTFITLASTKHKLMSLPPETMKSDFLRNFMQNLGCELAPVTAILGGQLAQDVINVLGKREQPIQNLLIFDGEESKGPIYALHPIVPIALPGDELIP
ncbi:MAG: hypothetical protein M1814_006205 [Vezdaea aestivalis]|nr:MAG: hypothetical protein M1814_006205 [Vezdaea aestivalis]